MRNTPGSEVEETTEGYNVVVEEPKKLVTYEISRDPAAISKASELDNPWGKK